jgi:hypothetical protein
MHRTGAELHGMQKSAISECNLAILPYLRPWHGSYRKMPANSRYMCPIESVKEYWAQFLSLAVPGKDLFRYAEFSFPEKVDKVQMTAILECEQMAGRPLVR